MKSRNRGVTSAASEHTMTSNTRSTIIETMAEAMFTADGHLGTWAEVVTFDSSFADRWRARAATAYDTHLTALEASGMAVVQVSETRANALEQAEMAAFSAGLGLLMNERAFAASGAPGIVRAIVDAIRAIPGHPLAASTDGKAPAPQGSAEGVARSEPNPATEDET